MHNRECHQDQEAWRQDGNVYSTDGALRLPTLCTIATSWMAHIAGTTNSPLLPEMYVNWSISAASFLKGEYLKIMDNCVAFFSGSSDNGFLVSLDQDSTGTITCKRSQN